MQLVWAAPSGSTSGIAAPAFHTEPRDQILMEKFELWLSLGPSEQLQQPPWVCNLFHGSHKYRRC